MDEPAAMHPFDLGVLIVGTVFLALALWGILDGPCRKDGEGYWRRRMLVVAVILGGGYLVIAGWRFGTGVLFGGAFAGRRSGMAMPSAWAGAAVDPLTPAALACLSVLGGALATWGVTTACRKGRLHALAGTAVLLFGLAAFTGVVFVINGGLPGYGDMRRHGFLPEVCIPGRSEEFVLIITLLLLPIVAVALIAGLVRLFRTPAEGEPRLAILARVLATGTFASALCLLRLDLYVTQNLRQYAIYGPRATMSLWSVVQDAILRSPVTLATAGLGLIAVALGFPALRLRRMQEVEAQEEAGEEGEDGGPAPH